MTISLIVPLYAETSRDVLSITIEKPFGYTWYDLEHAEADTTINGSTFAPLIRSQLNFPIDHFRIGVGLVSYRSSGDERHLYLKTGVNLWGAVTPGFFQMRDQDWVGSKISGNGSNSQALMKISDTYSSTKSIVFGGKIERELTEMHILREPFLLGIGIGGGYYDYAIYGLSGRQIQPDSQWVDVELPASEKVATYFTYDVESQITLRSESPILGLHWDAQFHPLIFAHSYDDHILRLKSITMDCWGVGGALEASMPLQGFDQTRDFVSVWVPYLRAELNRAWGNMTQTYYGDSPDTPQNETGQSIHGINSTVNNWIIGGGVHLNFVL